eukprot:TRINITY_DN7862_c0_g1_i1.p1 TRINITY_DN7862_c0_g1~~TRINITY_DN7862_c0_g1_i1.p1  ORF type:complete len:230 (+),score=40.99 TRINITY_DN7862_c0_g1_i1:228-917(+)
MEKYGGDTIFFGVPETGSNSLTSGTTSEASLNYFFNSSYNWWPIGSNSDSPISTSGSGDNPTLEVTSATAPSGSKSEEVEIDLRAPDRTLPILSLDSTIQNSQRELLSEAFEAIHKSRSDDAELRKIAAQHTITKDGVREVDVSCLLEYSQRTAARILDGPNSTFSKKWRQVTHNRKWPYREIRKLNQAIGAIEKNIPYSTVERAAMTVSQSRLLKQKEEQTRPVYIQL